jgi:hypothetical protein
MMTAETVGLIHEIELKSLNCTKTRNLGNALLECNTKLEKKSDFRQIDQSGGKVAVR